MAASVFGKTKNSVGLINTLSCLFYAIYNMNKSSNCSYCTETEIYSFKAWIFSCYLVIAICGMVGNFLVMSIILKNNDIRHSSFGVYLFGLAMADFGVAVLCLPTYITSTSNFRHHPSGLAGDILCTILTAYNILFYFEIVSIYTLVAIWFERYAAVCKPLATYSSSTPKKARKILCAVWLLSLIPFIPTIYGTRYTPTQELSSIGAHCTVTVFTTGVFWNILYHLIFVMQSVLPLTFLIFCFVKTQKALQRQFENLGKTQNSQTGALHLIKQREKTLITIVIVTVSFFSLWTPDQIVFILYQFNVVTSWNTNIMQVTVVLYFSSCCINPIIYTFRSKLFRKGMKASLCFPVCLGKKRHYLELP